MEDKEDIIQVVTATMEAREDTTLIVVATKEDKVATILVEEVVKEGREGITRDMEAREDKVDIIRVEVEGREDIILDKEAKEDKVDIILAEVEAMEGREDIIPEETATRVDREDREGTILGETFLNKGATPAWARVCGRSPAVPSLRMGGDGHYNGGGGSGYNPGRPDDDDGNPEEKINWKVVGPIVGGKDSCSNDSFSLSVSRLSTLFMFQLLLLW